MKERLQKVMASAGVASRRQCEELILQGVVRVNGKVVDELPAFADPEHDQITVSGRRLRFPRRVYFLVNKPKGVISTSHDPQGRPSAVSLVPTSERVFCVGRLDADTMGLLILTNDSELTNLLTHPRYKVPKTYVARVSGHLDDAAVERLRKGVWLAEGKTGRADVKILHNGREEAHLEITIRQGLNRQVRRMLARVGLSVQSLKRTRIGPLKIEGLGVGQYRPLTPSEVDALRRTATARPSGPVETPTHRRRKPAGEPPAKPPARRKVRRRIE
ncbi:MAG TPA: pseudouridine synthase [Sedimentisphaerales bacterium]|nr:rRNA pseudouridine synthase [Phycisphaerae bacterium]HON93519.1 pseudouridine synthase [Sedimentisphaerales bacterium]HQG47680.1 pseudouridine synthase [Sedimentisphaerales bacterium]